MVDVQTINRPRQAWIEILIDLPESESLIVWSLGVGFAQFTGFTHSKLHRTAPTPTYRCVCSLHLLVFLLKQGQTETRSNTTILEQKADLLLELLFFTEIVGEAVFKLKL